MGGSRFWVFSCEREGSPIAARDREAMRSMLEQRGLDHHVGAEQKGVVLATKRGIGRVGKEEGARDGEAGCGGLLKQRVEIREQPIPARERNPRDVLGLAPKRPRFLVAFEGVVGTAEREEGADTDPAREEIRTRRAGKATDVRTAIGCPER